MIIPVYKKIGESTHLLAKHIGQIIFKSTKNVEELKATHTGTLDPMAEGVIIVLTGKDRFLKEKIASVKKTYVFEILWGISTDSLDLLGIITDLEKNEILREKIEAPLKVELKKIIGKQKQLVPDFSAKRINGKSFFDQAKKNTINPKIYQEIEVFDVKLLSFTTLKSNRLINTILEKISLVEGDFRQTKIVTNWQENLKKLKSQGFEKFLLSKIEITTSKRFYIRGLVRDLAKKIGITATTFSIIRTKNGKFEISDCEVRYNRLLPK